MNDFEEFENLEEEEETVHKRNCKYAIYVYHSCGMHHNYCTLAKKNFDESSLQQH